MVENNSAVVSDAEVVKPSFGKRLLANLKERGRKFIVNLKRRPMNIAFFVLIISTIVSLCSLGNLSQLGLSSQYSKSMQGTCIFINTLFGILVLMLFMNSFPKRAKKPNIVMLVLTFVFMAVLIGVDLYLYIIWGINHTEDLARGATEIYYNNLAKFYPGAMGGVMAHLILVIISAILTATYPLYGKLINKINTRVDIQSSDLKEEIDTSAEV